MHSRSCQLMFLRQVKQRFSPMNIHKRIQSCLASESYSGVPFCSKVNRLSSNVYDFTTDRWFILGITKAAVCRGTYIPPNATAIKTNPPQLRCFSQHNFFFFHTQTKQRQWRTLNTKLSHESWKLGSWREGWTATKRSVSWYSKSKSCCRVWEAMMIIPFSPPFLLLTGVPLSFALVYIFQISNLGTQGGIFLCGYQKTRQQPCVALWHGLSITRPGRGNLGWNMPRLGTTSCKARRGQVILSQNGFGIITRFTGNLGKESIHRVRQGCLERRVQEDFGRNSTCHGVNTHCQL